MENQVEYPGVPFQIGRRTFIVSSLSLAQAKQNHDLLSRVLDNANPYDLIDEYLPLVGAALRRNYPDVANDQLLDQLDMLQFVELCKIVQFASGYKRVTTLGEATPTA